MQDHIKQLIERSRLPLSDEKETQAAIATLLDQYNITYTREHRLSSSDIVDFRLTDDVVIEVKIKGQRAAIVRQIYRYASYGTVKSIILVTSRSIVLPGSLCGKPVAVASLSKGWL